MKIEELNKSQIILLTLLVSFVTSIATGIVTVSLIEKAPSGVTQTINRVVERTVEKVTPGETKIVPAVSENEMLVSAVSTISKSIVPIMGSTTAGIDLLEVEALGFAYTKGVLITDKSAKRPSYSYTAKIAGKDVPINPIEASSTLVSAFSFSNKDSLPVVSLGKVDSLKLGQMVFTVSGALGEKVSVGIIKTINKEFATTTDTTAKVLSIETSIDSKDISLGSPLVTLAGDVVGIYLNSGNDSNKAGVFTPISTIGKITSN